MLFGASFCWAFFDCELIDCDDDYSYCEEDTLIVFVTLTFFLVFFSNFVATAAALLFFSAMAGWSIFSRIVCGFDDSKRSRNGGSVVAGSWVVGIV